MYRLIMNIMSNGQEVLSGAIGASEEIMHHVLGDLVCLGGGVQVILGVKVKVCDVVAKFFHSGLASSIARREWRPHVSRHLPTDIPERHLILDHLRLPVSI
jgi:hypothetical protein